MAKASLSLFLVFCLSVAFAQGGKADSKFVVEAAQGNRAEVVLGRLATQRGFAEPIKQFGSHMVKDHSIGYAVIRRLAVKKKIAIPAAAKAEDQKLYDKLAKLTGHDFDVEYQKAMIEDHEKDVAAFEEEAAKGSDADVKAYAKKYLPKLREHFKIIKEIKL